MTPPLVSIDICTRDRPGLLECALRSVYEQTYRPLELVVVDHGSHRPVRIEAPPDIPVEILHVPGEMPLGAARNAALDASSGELVAFLDDDDTWRPEKLDRQVAALASAPPEVAAVECGFDLWDGGVRVGRYLPAPDRDLPTALLRDPYLQPSTVLADRSAVLDAGGFEADVSRGEDWLLWVRFSDHHRALALPEVLVDRRASDPPPDRLLAGYQVVVERLRPRIERLAEADRQAVEAYHQQNVAILRARMGDLASARRGLWSVWRSDPRNLRPLLHLARTVIGEGAWKRSARVRDRWRARGRS